MEGKNGADEVRGAKTAFETGRDEQARKEPKLDFHKK